MVEVMKVMMTSFKRSHACTAALRAPNPSAGHHWPTPLLETPGHSHGSLDQSLVRSLLLSPGSWWTQGSVCAPQESISQSCVCSGGSLVGLMVTSCERAYAIPTSAAPRALPLPLSTADLYLHRDHLNTVLSQSLWGPWVLVHTRFVWALWESLAEWGLILNANSSLLPSCWGFSFALGYGVSPHSHSSAYSLIGVSLTSSEVQPPLLTLEVGYLLTERRFLSPSFIYI